MTSMGTTRGNPSPVEVGIGKDLDMSTPPPALTTELPRLSRSRPGIPRRRSGPHRAPGLGNFHRAHQAWYTSHAADAAAWGIAGFTGRRPDMAERSAPQDGLSTLITRSAEADTFEVISAVSARYMRSTEHDRYLDYLRQPEVAVVTITVTEPGYLADPIGRLILTDAVAPTSPRCRRTRPRR